MNVCVVVLGDVGRSPRMQYHSLTLAKYGYNVDIIGYKGSKLLSDVNSNVRINQCLMNEPPNFNKYLPKLLSYGLKIIWQSIALLYCLFLVRRPNFVLAQNPPSVPTLPILWFYNFFIRAQIIIDWHNYGYTILSLSYGPNHKLVKIYKWMEGYFGSKFNRHFCVTNALKKDLKSRWNIDAEIVCDFPYKIFKPISLKEKHNILMKLSSEFKKLRDPNSPSSTRMTDYDETKNLITEKSNRPAFIISSTSWTKDEDFQILIDAFDAYEKICENSTTLRNLICIITGKGPMKEYYSNEIKNKIWKHVEIIMPWLEPADYPKLMAACDLGICLHTSSSGLDIPMKILDMFGCGVPVCAIKYDCLRNELIGNDQFGKLFSNSSELAQCLATLLDTSLNNNELNNMVFEIKLFFSRFTWEVSWLISAKNYFK